MPWRDARPPIDWDAQPLGAETDTEIARRLDCATSTVTEARRRRKIAPASTAMHRIGGTGPVSPTEWGSQPLGQMSDTALAHQLGVHPTTVRHHRVLAGIPPYATRDERRAKWDEVAATSAALVDVSGLAADGPARTGVSRRLTSTRTGVTEMQAARAAVAAIDWSAVDWSRSNRQLGRDHGDLSHEVFRRRRPKPADDKPA